MLLLMTRFERCMMKHDADRLIPDKLARFTSFRVAFQMKRPKRNTGPMMEKPSVKNPFADSIRALKRLAERFASLANSGTDPAGVSILVRRPVSQAHYEMNWGEWFHPDRERRYRHQDSANHPVVREGRTLGDVGSSHINKSLECWHFTYAEDSAHAAINAIAADAAALIGRKHEHLKSTLWAGATNEVHPSILPGYWRSTVHEIARLQYSGTPLIDWARPLNQNLVVDWEWQGTPFPEPWKMEPQPYGWMMELPHISSASVQALDVLIDWAENDKYPIIGADANRIPDPATAGYLGLRVDAERRVITGGDRVPVDLHRSGVQWSIFHACFKAMGEPLTLDQQRSLDGEESGRRSAKSELNSRIAALDIRITEDFRLISTTA